MSADSLDLKAGQAKEFRAPKYAVEANRDFLDFQRVTTTKEEDKPWGKVAVEVSVTKADGTVVEGVDANAPFFTFVDGEGKQLTVSADASGHIDSLHIKGEDMGSKFDEPSLEALFQDAAKKMPEGIANEPGVSAFDIEMGKSMGKEGISSMKELVALGAITEADVQEAEKVRETVAGLNKTGDKDSKEGFIAQFKEKNAGCKIQFQLVRGEVLVPIVDAPKQDTTKLFMVFGPGATGDKTLYTAAPGRNMPRQAASFILRIGLPSNIEKK